MKKIISLAVAMALVLCFTSVFVSAEGADGYEFAITGVNGSHSGEDNYISTNAEAFANVNAKWAITILLEHVEGTTFKAVQDAIAPTGTAPELEFTDTRIALSVHSSTSDTSLADTYPNVFAKNAAIAVTAGMYFTFKNVTLENVLAGNIGDKAVAACSLKAPDNDDTTTLPGKSENLALNATVVTAPAYTTAYNGIVNDGIIGEAAYDNKWAGFYYNEGNENNNFDGITGEIIIDLGKSYDLNSFRTHIWGAAASGISAVSKLEVYVSDDGVNFTSVASTTDAPGLSGDPAWIELNANASGRFVKYTYEKSEGVFIFVSEVEAYGAVPSTGEPSSEPASEPTSKPTTETSDNGIIALVVIASLAVAGAVVAKKFR